MIDKEGFETIEEVHEGLKGTERGVALQWLLNQASEVAIKRAPKGRHRYAAQFDDGAYLGGWVFEWSHAELLPLNVLLRVAGATNWPGHVRRVNELRDATRKMFEAENDQ